jgi:lysozyme
MSSARLGIAALTLSAAAFGALVGFEGYSERAIIPVAGDVPTLGFGTTKGVKLGDSIDPVRAVNRALIDVSKFEGAAKRCITVPLHQHEYDAYIQLSYNIGPTAFCNSTLARKLNALDYAGACAEILRWDRFQGRPLAGLTARRLAEHQLCRGRVQ